MNLLNIVKEKQKSSFGTFLESGSRPFWSRLFPLIRFCFAPPFFASLLFACPAAPFLLVLLQFSSYLTIGKNRSSRTVGGRGTHPPLAVLRYLAFQRRSSEEFRLFLKSLFGKTDVRSPSAKKEAAPLVP
jgi:hypothetical protein